MKNPECIAFLKKIKINANFISSFFIPMFLLLPSTFLISQNVDYQAQIISLYGSNCGNDGVFGGNNNEHTWEVGISNNLSPIGMTRYAKNTSSATTYYVNHNEYGYNQTITGIYYQIEGWEEDAGSIFSYDAGDDCHTSNFCYENFSSPPPVEYTMSPYQYRNCGNVNYNLNARVRYKYSTISLASAVDNSTTGFTSFGHRPFWGSRGYWTQTNLSTATSGTISHNQYSGFRTTVSCKSSVNFLWRNFPTRIRLVKSLCQLCLCR